MIWQDLLQAVSPRFLFSLGLDIAGMVLLVFGLYYRRYHDKELVTTAAMFNLFIFSVLSILAYVDFGMNIGFGLFAILALFTLRSEPLAKIEMTYFFGSVAIAVICAMGLGSPYYAASVVGLVIAGAYIIDHPRMLRSIGGTKITLDKIDHTLFSDPKAMRGELSGRLGVDVLSYQVLQLDYINELARLNVFFRLR